MAKAGYVQELERIAFNNEFDLKKKLNSKINE
jgi:hypothetical protein